MRLGDISETLRLSATNVYTIRGLPEGAIGLDLLMNLQQIMLDLYKTTGKRMQSDLVRIVQAFFMKSAITDV